MNNKIQIKLYKLKHIKSITECKITIELSKNVSAFYFICTESLNSSNLTRQNSNTILKEVKAGAEIKLRRAQAKAACRLRRDFL